MIYLNSGSHSITPIRILDAVTRYQREYEINPTLGLFEAPGKVWKSQERLARFFNADPRDLFLRSNVTAVLNEFILGVPLPRDAEIAITDLEYGAIANLVRFRCQRDGLTEKPIHLPGSSSEIQKLTQNSVLERVVSQLTPKTRMLVCSDVMTYNGLVVPLAELARETRRRNILLVVDGAHGPGSTDLNFSRLENVDFYGGNLHKWMLGPKGTSFGWVNRIHQDKLTPRLSGWCTFETPPPFDQFGGGIRFAARMYPVGCHDYAPFFAIHDLIDYWEELGPEKIRARIQELQSDLEDKLRRLDLIPLSPVRGSLRGPLLSFELPERHRANALQLFYDLARHHGLQVSMPLMQGRTVLRVSPHIYNTPEENTKAVEILKRVVYS